ncbi:MAG: helix-turn-helix domain-containing protein [Cryomorphaceae bacterium]|nr:helix-turn-helix domain-containing protein [Cryomorphaceae bacterium]
MEDQTTYKANHVGNRIRKIRELKNFTQEQVAEKLGMTISGYSRIEREEVSVSVDKLERIAQILGVSTVDISSFDASVFFNNYGSAEGQSFSMHKDVEAWKKLEFQYQSQIKQLESQVEYLRKQNDTLISKLGK